ncbi:vacuolar protein sorting complex subunit, putative [Leishmania tarentolae]|uniref:Vacuolar protein sorting complex subunit, putative n=1 Tax=Leishmania tarentolae TaxID=5689 RepID=A0A640KK31_LEITA|nr:vacuolar protein sorting complex subunit, putative [Leishmania tarentolae]
MKHRLTSDSSILTLPCSRRMPHKRHFDRTSRLGSWISLGTDALFRLSELEDYSNSLPFKFDNALVAHSGCGGLVALFCHRACNFSTNENSVFLFHLAGTALQKRTRIPLKAIESVVYMTWNKEADHLIVVLNTGFVHFYNYCGATAAPSLPMEIPVVCASCDNGFVALVDTVTEAKLVLVYLGPQKEYTMRELSLPHSIRQFMTTIALVTFDERADKKQAKEVFLSYSPWSSNSFICRCIFGTSSSSFIELDVPVEGGRVLQMCRSPTGSAVAFMMLDGSVYSTNSGFSEVSLLRRTDTTPESFVQMTWCGSHCVVYLQRMQYGSASDEGECEDSSCSLFLVNVEEPDNSDCISDLPFDACLLPEKDGVWVLSRESLYFLQIAPLAVQHVFSVGSRAAGAMLVATYDEFMTGDASAVRMLRNLEHTSGALVEAVAECVATAGFEFDAAQQKRLLRIAAFGRTFCSLCDSSSFIVMAKRLRVRNHLRFQPLGMIVTDQQLTDLGELRLIQRLIMCSEYHVGFCVAEALGSDVKPVMLDWAMCKLARVSIHNKDEELEVANQIVKKLKSCRFTAFAELAQQAKVTGRSAAAVVLLNAEVNPSQQVPMLLRIGEPDMALKRAIQAVDADLVFTVMVHMIRSRGSAALSALTSHKISCDLLLQYVGVCEGNQQLMAEYFNKHPRAQAYFYLRSYFREETRMRNAMSQPMESENWEMLQECKSVDIRAAIVWTKKAVEQTPRPQPTTTAFSPIIGSGTPFPAFMIEERFLQLESSLLEEQTQLMNEYKDHRFLRASAADTIRYALEHGRTSVAQRLKNAFSVPEKMFQRCMLSAYLCTSQWDLIDDMSGISSNKKTLLDGEAFVTALLSYKRPQQAKQYISRIPKIEMRMEYYVLCSDWFSAGADCKRNNDPDLLTQLKDRAKGNPDVLRQIEEGWNTPPQTSGISFPKFF